MFLNARRNYFREHFDNFNAKLFPKMAYSIYRQIGFINYHTWFYFITKINLKNLLCQVFGYTLGSIF